MNIRELVNFIDLMELDLQGNRNMNINYQGRPVDNTPANLLQFPPGNVTGTRGGQAGTSSTAPQGAPAPTGDPTLNRPLPPRAPRDPNAPGLATRVGRGLGQIGKAIGAVASVPQGVGRAVKKGYQAGLQTIGGPGPGGAAPASGSAPRAAGSAPSAAGGGGGYDEVADLRQLVNRLDARVTALSARIPAQTAPAQAVGEHRRPRRLRVVR